MSVVKEKNMFMAVLVLFTLLSKLMDSQHFYWSYDSASWHSSTSGTFSVINIIVFLLGEYLENIFTDICLTNDGRQHVSVWRWARGGEGERERLRLNRQRKRQTETGYDRHCTPLTERICTLSLRENLNALKDRGEGER